MLSSDGAACFRLCRPVEAGLHSQWSVHGKHTGTDGRHTSVLRHGDGRRWLAGKYMYSLYKTMNAFLHMPFIMFLLEGFQLLSSCGGLIMCSSLPPMICLSMRLACFSDYESNKHI